LLHVTKELSVTNLLFNKKNVRILLFSALTFLVWEFIHPSGGSIKIGFANCAAVHVGKWKRYEVSYGNSSFNGNPFDVEFYGIFRHETSSQSMTQIGFYAGGNTWKIFFMPNKTGKWRFETRSTDPDLNEKIGTFECVASGLEGRLIPDKKRWKLEDVGNYDAPIMIPSREYFKSTSLDRGINKFIDWADNVVGARLIGTTLVYFKQNQDAVPYMKGKEGYSFNIQMWDRLNEHYDYLRDKGMGHYIMLYSDDAEAPSKNGIEPMSKEELRLFRYVIARFSCYPIVIWDTGIDIGETRTNEWVEWFASWFLKNDPWQHPVGSRSGGGSGGINPVNGTYYSDGTSTLPSSNDYVDEWKKRDKPTAMTDRWREDYGRGSFDRGKIRRAVWELGLVGGTALYVGGNEGSGYLTASYANDFKAAADCGRAANFFRNEIIGFDKLYPHNELVLRGLEVVVAADLEKEYVMYFPNGGSAEIDLTNVSGSLLARWFDPLAGKFINIQSIIGGARVNFNCPDADRDWVLHLISSTDSENNILPPPSKGNRLINNQ
jgi:hypothetical protein